MSTLEKIEKAVVTGYKNIEEGVVEGYKKIEDGVVSSFNKMSDGFVEKHLVKEGETVEEAKERIAKEQAERTKIHTNVKPYNHEEAMKAQKEMIEKSIESAKNAGKR
jgi:hypothetical protein